MATTVTLNGVSYSVPANRESRGTWGVSLSAYLVALSTGVLQKAGGAFTLTADADFGASFGLVAAYLKSRSSNISTTGVVRLANNEGIGWRNAGNSADFILKVNASNVLEFNGTPVPSLALGTANQLLGMNAGATANEYKTIQGTSNQATVTHGVGTVTIGTAQDIGTGSAVTFASVNKVTLTAPATGSALTIADGKTLTASNTLTFTGTDASSVAFGAGGTVTYTSDKLSVFAATTSAELAGVISDETGSGALVFATSPTLTTPNIGVATATSVNKVTLTAPASSATLTIADGKTLTVSNTLTFTGTDASSVAFGAGGTVAYTSNKLSAFAATTSAELAGVISDETGSGALVFATSPTLTTPTLGVASATTINKVTLTAPATGSTLTIADGKTLTVSNTLTFTGTDASSVAFGTGGTVAYTANKLSVFAATTSAELAGVISDETGSGALTFATSPALTTPTVATAATFNAQAELRLADSDSSNYVGFKAPATVGANKIWTLPDADGSANQVLATNGSGTLQWASGLSTSLTQYNVSVGNASDIATSTNTNLLGDVKASIVSTTVTMTIATPCVVSHTSHGLSTGDKVYFTTSGALPTGVSASTTYFVIKVDANSYNLATTMANAVAGTKVASSGSQSGTHTAFTGGLIHTPGLVRGDQSGSAIGVGYIGQKISASISDVTMTTGGTVYNLGTISSLAPGVWMVYAHSRISVGATTEPALLSISTTSATRDLTNENRAGAVNSGSLYAQLGTVAYIATATTIPIYMVGHTASNSMQSYADSSYFFAIRIG